MVSRILVLRPIAFILDGVPLRQHALVQDAGNDNASGLLPVKDDMPPTFHAAQAGTNIIIGSAQSGSIGEHLTPRLKIVEVVDRPICAPGAQAISTDAQQVGFGAAR